MRIALVATLLAAAAVPASAQAAPEATTAVVAHTGQMLRDAANTRLGAVDSVKPDGSVGVILNGRYVVIPISTLSVTDGKLTTSLSKKALTQLN